MILRLPAAQQDAVLGAMRAIALAHGRAGVTAEDRATMIAAAHVVLGRDGADVDPDTFVPVDPGALAATMHGDDDARTACRMLAVMALVDGRIDAAKIGLVGEFATALGVHEDYLRVLAEAAQDEIAQASACMIRKNAESFPSLDASRLGAGPLAVFLPYRDGAEDPGLEARYLALAAAPPGSFGRAFHDHFVANGFRFPGHPDGLAEGFTTPHDTSHVLSGYSTRPDGELCVSTFIGAMHPDHPMAAEVLPVIFSWHLGIRLNDIAGARTGAFEPRRFWTAWDRGAATTVDVLDPAWDFWAATEVPLEELRRDHGVPPVAPDLLA
ncbi:MAG: hypothetical protein AB7V62_04515 [Thermoleophilia bacterium]